MQPSKPAAEAHGGTSAGCAIGQQGNGAGAGDPGGGAGDVVGGGAVVTLMIVANVALTVSLTEVPYAHRSVCNTIKSARNYIKELAFPILKIPAYGIAA